MARSVFYYHLKKLREEDKYAGIKRLIREIYNENKGRYGYRRITMELHNRGHLINHKTVRRLMINMGLKCMIRVKKYKSYRGVVGTIVPNVLDRDFEADSPNRKWTTDVTQIKIGENKLYLSPIIDMFNGEVISYNVSDSPNMELIYNMLDNAFGMFDNLTGLVLHSDQGWQYQQKEYQRRLKDRGIVQSMSRKGNCLDNAVAENFFGIMKSELLYCNRFSSVEEFVRALHEYITYYNNVRIKLRLNGTSPVQYRTHYLAIYKL